MAAFASLPSGQFGTLAQAAAELSNARWKPVGCDRALATGSWARSSAPSSTIARTWVGNCAANSTPIAVP